MDRKLRVKHLVWAIGIYAAYVLYADHTLLHRLVDFLAHMQGG